MGILAAIGSAIGRLPERLAAENVRLSLSSLVGAIGLRALGGDVAVHAVVHRVASALMTADGVIQPARLRRSSTNLMRRPRSGPTLRRHFVVHLLRYVVVSRT